MADWYVRKDASHGGTNTGASYANAWQGWASIVWGGTGVVAGDTLYVCGIHSYPNTVLAMTAHGGSSALPVTIRGDYAPSPGSFVFSGTGYLSLNQAWTTVRNLTFSKTISNAYTITVNADGARVIGCTITGGTEGVRVNNVTVTLCEVTGCTITNVGAAGFGYLLTTASVNASGVTIADNLIHDSGYFGIYFHIKEGAGTTSRINNVKIRNNEVYNTVGSSIQFFGTTVDPGIPTVFSSGLELTGNYVHDCGRTSGDTGSHGGLHVGGAVHPLIYGNTVRNVYATGAGIQTYRNYAPVICFNIVSGVRAGTPTALYQNGLPIDGNGIFFDNNTVGGIAFGNHISDLITTGNVASGAGLAFWDCTGATYYGNIIENVACGAMYGADTESGNGLYNNTFINCTVGIQKAGGWPPAGNIEVRNNLLVNCATGFASTITDAKITNSYNCIYGSTTAYSNITAGANDITTVNPNLDAEYRPRAVELIRKASYLNPAFRDYYSKHFYGPPNFGAVEALSDTQRYILKRT